MIHSARLIEEVREEVLAKAREKREFRQKNLDAAGTRYSRMYDIILL